MTLIEALTILAVHNRWRHGDEVAPETHPASLTQAIDLIGEKVPQMIYALHEAREEMRHHPCRPDALDYIDAALGE